MQYNQYGSLESNFDRYDLVALYVHIRFILLASMEGVYFSTMDGILSNQGLGSLRVIFVLWVLSNVHLLSALALPWSPLISPFTVTLLCQFDAL